jgi:hypothetical protein
MSVIPIVGSPTSPTPEHLLEKRMKNLVRTSSALLLLGCCSALAAEERAEAEASCREETKRVVVWPHGPKAQPAARFEDREVTVCDAKVSKVTSPNG